METSVTTTIKIVTLTADSKYTEYLLTTEDTLFLTKEGKVNTRTRAFTDNDTTLELMGSELVEITHKLLMVDILPSLEKYSSIEEALIKRETVTVKVNDNLKVQVILNFKESLNQPKGTLS